jgi:hypothetical protein
MFVVIWIGVKGHCGVIKFRLCISAILVVPANGGEIWWCLGACEKLLKFCWWTSFV